MIRICASERPHSPRPGSAKTQPGLGTPPANCVDGSGAPPGRHLKRQSKASWHSFRLAHESAESCVIPAITRKLGRYHGQAQRKPAAYSDSVRSRDARKEPLPGLCPRPQDFRRNISGVRWPAIKTAPDNYHRQRPDALSAHRRPGYPLSGCVPAEPDSVSPGNHTVAARSSVRKYASDPELCLKNPNRFQKASK